MIAYSYEAGVADVFGIPLGLISLNLTVVLTAIGALAAISIPFLFVLHLAYPFLGALVSKNTALYRILFRYVCFLLLLGALWLPLRSLRHVIALVAFGVPLGILWELVFPLFAQRSKKTYGEKLQAQENLEHSVRFGGDALMQMVYSYTGLGGLVALVCTVVALFVAHYAGTDQASTQRDFYVLSKPSNAVVLRVYGDHLICSTFDHHGRILRGELFVLTAGEDSGLSLRLARVGPLRRADVQTGNADSASNGLAERPSPTSTGAPPVGPASPPHPGR